ncbi:MAG: hypothetical protein ABI888_00095 [Chloroflexota bacterium]
MIENAVAETITRELKLVRDTAARKPKAWGELAARGVVTFRTLAGRAPTEDERRAIWAGLWQAADVISRGG